MIDTNVVNENGYYGIVVGKDKKKYVKKLGKIATLAEVFESIEDDSVQFKLVCDYFGKQKVAYISHGELSDLQLGKNLSELGFDVTRASQDAFVDSIRLQEEALEANGVIPTCVYASLGWIELSFCDPKTETMVSQPCYRCHKIMGFKYPAKYIGPYDIVPIGSYSEWRQLMKVDVIPYPALQLVLVAALSAVVVGLLAMKIPIENPIVHLNLPSGKGKSTAGYVAASTVGKPFEGTCSMVNDDGKIVEMQSVYQSWGATDNAMVATQAGNRGVVTVLNELGKSLTKNMTRLIFDLSEGSDKKRLNTSLKANISKGYSTTFISTGESSLLEKCDTKLEGLAVRVMEITKPLTRDAEHANRIKEGCSNHCGFAAPKLARYIIRNGGIDFVLTSYKKWVQTLRSRFSSTPSMERFVEKFAALFVTTAEIATDALELPFDIDGLLRFLDDYDQENGPARNTSASSYDLIIQTCRANAHRFYERSDKSRPGVKTSMEAPSVPYTECWGRITNMAKEYIDGRIISQEFEIRKKYLEELLKKEGFLNKSTCLAAWRAMGVLDDEDEHHPCRSRKIDPSSAKGSPEDVYVLRAFANEQEAAEIRTEKQKEEEKMNQRRLKLERQKKRSLIDCEEEENNDA